LLKLLISAAAAAMLLTGPAHAVPLAAPSALLDAAAQHDVTEQVRHQRWHATNRSGVRRGHRAPHRYKPGSRLREAPRGYRRYNARPRDWDRRGCVVVGPFWFCP
jgi:Ni/Co efflux regulator RcnB